MGAHPSVDTIRRYGYGLLAMGRPAFLLGTLPLYLVGVALAREAGFAFRLAAAVLGLLLVWLVQLATHYENEYRDVETDAATRRPTRISGGSRVLVRGIVPRRVARLAARSCLSLALVLAVAVRVAFDAGPWFPFLVASAIAGGWFYSSPPLSLSSRGLGEVTVAAISGFAVPATAYVLQASQLDPMLASISLSLVFLSFSASLATALPDVEADRETGKRTLPARIGRRPAVAVLSVTLLSGWLAFGYVASSIDSTLGPAAFVCMGALLSGYARYAPAATRGGIDAAERVGMAAAGALGWAGVAMVALLVV